MNVENANKFQIAIDLGSEVEGNSHQYEDFFTQIETAREDLKIMGMGKIKLVGPYQGSHHMFYYGPQEHAEIFADRVRESGLAKSVRVDEVFPNPQ